MRIQTASDLFLTEVQDLYDAEKQLLRALPRMAKNAASPELADAFRQRKRQQGRPSNFNKLVKR
jgi:ferritin-like metal-binding protein YciE